MTRKIPDAQLSLLNGLIARHFGLHFPPEQWSDWSAVYALPPKNAAKHAESYLNGLLSSASAQNQMEILVNHLTIGETYFFREKRALEILEGRIVPDLARTGAPSAKQLRIWSAGCASGEEPYSVAMTLSRILPGLKDWNIEILATDVNTRSLRKASEGIYSEWSFRGTPPWVRRAYFEPTEGGRWAIAAAIKKMVRFTPVNLMDDAYPLLSICPNGLDVIFCRNVLMYFTPEGMRNVIRRFYQYLTRDGWLIVSPTETSHNLFSDFTTVNFGDVTLYRKSDKRLPATLALPAGDEPKSSVHQPPVHRPQWIVRTAEPWATHVCHLDRGNLDSGNQATGSVQVSSGLPAASSEQARGPYEQRHYEEAERKNEEARPKTGALQLENRSDAQTMLSRARIHANQGKLSEALAWCDKAIAADKMVARAHYLRATILQEQSSIPEAIFALKRAVYAEPQFVLGHFTLGNLAFKQGRRKDSAKHFENVLLLLAQYDPEDIVPESEGLSAGKLIEIIVASGARGPATQPSRQRTRAAKQIGNLDLARR